MKPLIPFLNGKKIKYFFNKSIKPYTSMQIGGKINTLVIASTTTQLKELLKYLQTNNQNYILLGSGTNIIFPDQYCDYTVIINKTARITKPEEGILKVNTGLLNSRLLAWNILNRIGGMEFLAGLPGTIGGAAAVNAGAFGKSMEDLVHKAEIFTLQGDIKLVGKDYFRYAYRDSVFKTGNEVILNLYLRYDLKEEKEIRKKIKQNLKYRRANHPPPGLNSAGCFFKNPLINNTKVSAGKLIQLADLKGIKEKNLLISEKHANFILNSGNSSFTELQHFAESITRKVWEKHRVKLIREVTYISLKGKKY